MSENTHPQPPQTAIPHTFSIARLYLSIHFTSDPNGLYGDLVSQPIPRSQMVAEATAYRASVFEFDPRGRNPATVAYQKLVDRVYHG